MDAEGIEPWTSPCVKPGSREAVPDGTQASSLEALGSTLLRRVCLEAYVVSISRLRSRKTKSLRQVFPLSHKQRSIAPSKPPRLPDFRSARKSQLVAPSDCFDLVVIVKKTDTQVNKRPRNDRWLSCDLRKTKLIPMTGQRLRDFLQIQQRISEASESARFADRVGYLS